MIGPLTAEDIAALPEGSKVRVLWTGLEEPRDYLIAQSRGHCFAMVPAGVISADQCSCYLLNSDSLLDRARVDLKEVLEERDVLLARVRTLEIQKATLESYVGLVTSIKGYTA